MRVSSLWDPFVNTSERDNIITAKATKDRYTHITTGVSFASVVESHRVKIGKVQSARRRHRRDVKEEKRETWGQTKKETSREIADKER